MQESFDIVKIFDQLKNSSLLSDLTLSKYQKAMIPYFKSHLVSFTDEADDSSSETNNHSSVNWDSLDKEQRSLIKKGLLQLAICKVPSKVNQRILKNLTIQDKQFERT